VRLSAELPRTPARTRRRSHQLPHGLQPRDQRARHLGRELAWRLAVRDISAQYRVSGTLLTSILIERMGA